MKPQVNKYQVISDDLCQILRKYQLKAIEYGAVFTDTSNPHGENFSHLYRLNYILEGHAFYTCSNKTTRIESGSVVFLPPESILEVEENGNPVTLLFINFEVENLNERQNFNELMRTAIPNHHVHDKDNLLRHLFNQLFDEGNKKGIGYCMCVQGIFYNLLVNVIRFGEAIHLIEEKQDSSSSSIGYFNEAIHYINKHISSNIKIKDIATSIGVSEIYLYKIFMKHTNKSPRQLLIDYRIQLAKNYLRNPNLSIKMISTELGFSTPNHFSAQFKKSTGLSPKEFRDTLYE